MSELLLQINELRRLDNNVHWFCSRKDGPDSEAQDASSAQERTTLAMDCMMIFSYTSPQAEEPQNAMKDGITRNLLRCDQCIANYYRAKQQMLENLRDDGYEDEQVDIFADMFDDQATERISRGLQRATDMLRTLPESERRPASMSRSNLMSMYEALHCEKFLKDNEKMSALFDEPFRLCQTKGRLSPVGVTPAMVRFAFCENEYRRKWAFKEWESRPEIESKEDFVFALRPGLSDVLPQAATSPVTDIPFVTRFWSALKIILSHLRPALITHGLRTLNIDVCRLTIDHLNIDTSTFRPLMESITVLLEKSPKDFWDAMGTISPHAIIEGIFHNSMYDKIVAASGTNGGEAYKDFQALVGWVRPFMISVQSSNQAPSCRQLASQFLQRLQGQNFPEAARTRCYEVGLNVLKWVILLRLQAGKTSSDAVSRAVAIDLLNIVTGYLDEIISRVQGDPVLGPNSHVIQDLCQDVVQAALTLECRLLRIEHETLAKGMPLSESSKHLSLSVWNKVVPLISSKGIKLAKATLPATTELSDLGQFGPKGPEELAHDRQRFNTQFRECVELMAKVFERVGDMNPKTLNEFVHDTKVRPALVAALLSSEEVLYEAAMEVAKNVSSEATREDALRFMLEPRLADTLNDFSEALSTISNSQNFYSCPRMLRTSSDILGILCDPQDGLLRKHDPEIPAKEAISKYWQRQWQALTTIYRMTETWSKEQDRNIMKEFCRDTMQFSARLFNEYVVFENASGSKGDSVQSHRKLLADPLTTMDDMVLWLRLRDEYLAATAVEIIKKILEQLRRAQMNFSNRVLTSLSGVVQDKIKTNLSGQQKAELSKALDGDEADGTILNVSSSRQESLSGESATLTARNKPQKLKAGTIDSWVAKGQSSETKVKDTVDLTADDGVSPMDKMILAHSSSLERFKKQEAGKPGVVQRKAEQKRSSEATQASFLEKRQKELNERKQKDAAAVAKLKAQNPNSLAGQTAGAGSALSGLGNLGKDHSAKKGSGILLSSDDEGSGRDDDDDDDDDALFGVSKGPKFSAGFKDLDALRRQTNYKGPVKKQKIVRSAKDMRARLTPNLSALHQSILAWDLFIGGDFPPGASRSDYKLVTNKFRTPGDYQHTFEPLLLLEAWQGFQQTIEEGFAKAFQLQVANRLTVDNLVEVSTSMEITEFQKIGLSESDIVIFATAKDFQAATCRCLGRLQKVGKRKANSIELSFRVSPQNNPLLSKLSANADVFGSRIGSLTPLEREYGALLGLQYFDLCDEIVKAVPSPLLKYSEEKLGRIGRMYDLNTAQAKAVQSAVDNDAFTLIQGPPGSGKTKTIVSIVGALMTETMRRSNGIAIQQPRTSNGQTSQSNASSAMKKLLLCAPSNAAVDELVMRLMKGVKTYSGETHEIKVIRLGKSDRINPKVAAVTLDELVSQQLNAHKDGENDKGPSEIVQAKEAHKKTTEEINALRAKLDEAESGDLPKDPRIHADLEKLKRQKQSLSTRIDQLKDSGNTKSRDMEIRRRKVQQDILDSAHVLCATLSGSGHDMFQSLKIDFETVIIDEAAQSVELSALIPLKYGCQKCIMVGDPKQLPPTVLSREAARFQYEQSLFVRMQNNSPENVHLLDTQYRMHPQISQFPSMAFYDNRLVDGKSMGELRTKFWHQDAYLGPYRFFDVRGKHESGPRGHSLVNRAEIEVAYQLYVRLRRVAQNYDFVGKIGIITPYKSQLHQLRDRFKQEFGEEIFKIIEFNTTDAFQGRESEVIIFSCVRASEGGIGFLSDIRRMNVGITRAKCSLWVIGNVNSLHKGEYWNKMIVDARQRQLVTDGDVRTLIKGPAKQLTNSESKSSSTMQQLPSTSPVSPVSPVEAPKIQRAYNHDAMDIDQPEIRNSLSSSSDSRLGNGMLNEKRKRSPLELENSYAAKSPRVEPTGENKGSDINHKVTSLDDKTMSNDSDKPDGIKNNKAKPTVTRRPPPKPATNTSIFIQKKSKKR